VRAIRERILILRDAEPRAHDAHPPLREKLVQLLNLRCGASKEAPERIFTVNGVTHPTIAIAPGERPFWRIVNASPDLYADLSIDSGQITVVARDGMPLAFHESARRFENVEHILLPPAGRVEAIVTGPRTGVRGILAEFMRRHRSFWRREPCDGACRPRSRLICASARCPKRCESNASRPHQVRVARAGLSCAFQRKLAGLLLHQSPQVLTGRRANDDRSDRRLPALASSCAANTLEQQMAPRAACSLFGKPGTLGSQLAEIPFFMPPRGRTQSGPGQLPSLLAA
jgi:Multicopper oxidase